MRSIRLSLMGYFLGLLALALGTASLLAYQTSYLTLQEKKTATEELPQLLPRLRTLVANENQ